jgi:hypothetical protein
MQGEGKFFFLLFFTSVIFVPYSNRYFCDVFFKKTIFLLTSFLQFFFQICKILNFTRLIFAEQTISNQTNFVNIHKKRTNIRYILNSWG